MRHKKPPIQTVIPGPCGDIEILVDFPAAAKISQPSGIALIAHPHPLHGGSFHNKVTYTLAQSLAQLGYLCIRPNFRGVGLSAGVFDHGISERKDLLHLVQKMYSAYFWQHISTDLDEYSTLPLVFAGFSFGSYVLSHVANDLKLQNIALKKMILVGTPVLKWNIATPTHEQTVLIHGEHDEVVPLQNVLSWAQENDCAVTVVPQASHFFDRKLHILKKILLQIGLA